MYSMLKGFTGISQYTYTQYVLMVILHRCVQGYMCMACICVLYLGYPILRVCLGGYMYMTRIYDSAKILIKILSMQ